MSLFDDIAALRESESMLDKELFAACPHGDGGIQFSAEFDFSDYRKLTEALTPADGDLKNAFFELEPQWRAICIFGKVDIKGGAKEGATVTHDTPVDDVRFEVLRWANDAFQEWLVFFLAGDDWRNQLSSWLMAQARVRPGL